MVNGAKLFVAIVIPSMLAIPAVACADASATNPPPTAIRQYSLPESQSIAEDFVKSEATFVFDGMKETLKLTSTSTTANRPQRFNFTFEFDSRHAGYGDRTGQMVAQVITHHRATVIVEQGKVVSATMDERWDMLEQKPL